MRGNNCLDLPSSVGLLSTLHSGQVSASRGGSSTFSDTEKGYCPLEGLFLGLCLYTFAPRAYSELKAQHWATQHTSYLVGGWQLETIAGDSYVSQVPILKDPEGSELVQIFMDPDGLVMLRAPSGRLWRIGVTVDAAKHWVNIEPYLFDSEEFGGAYVTIAATHDLIRFTPLGAVDKRPALELIRVPTLKNYPLLDRGFHLRNEWAYER